MDDRALALPAFRLFLTARTISWAGNAITLVALPLLMFQITGSPALTGLLTAVEAIPYLALGLVAGALADRWNRKRVLIVTGAFSGLTLATIPAAAALHSLTVPHVFLTALTMSTLFVFFDAAGFGALPELVGRDRIPSATANMVACNTVITLLGPAAGGALAAAIGPAWALSIDAAAYLIAAGVTARVHWQPARLTPPTPLSAQALWDDIGEGLQYIWRTRIVRWLTIIGAGASISAGAMLGLMIIVGLRQFTLTEHDPKLGLLYSASALGALIISLTISRIQRALPTGWITILALSISWLAQLAWAATTSVNVGLVILVFFQAATTLSIMNGIIVRQSLAPEHLQSRVNTIARMIAWGGTPVGALLGGTLAEHFSTSLAILICSAGTAAGLAVAAGAKLWRVPTLARLRSGPHAH
ncbi:MFS transporter [Leucobacter luti]|uniref:MFS transporter n=1 Tax=Leucobacter luti TaxID=340320 RepID=UPI001C68EC30|nr:MFS transporter [Leucobacter luti]QYM75013.1 MFS transporter [Leucobacter luti]